MNTMIQYLIMGLQHFGGCRLTGKSILTIWRFTCPPGVAIDYAFLYVANGGLLAGIGLSIN